MSQRKSTNQNAKSKKVWIPKAESKQRRKWLPKSQAILVCCRKNQKKKVLRKKFHELPVSLFLRLPNSLFQLVLDLLPDNFWGHIAVCSKELRHFVHRYCGFPSNQKLELLNWKSFLCSPSPGIVQFCKKLTFNWSKNTAIYNRTCGSQGLTLPLQDISLQHSSIWLFSYLQNLLKSTQIGGNIEFLPVTKKLGAFVSSLPPVFQIRFSLFDPKKFFDFAFSKGKVYFAYNDSSYSKEKRKLKKKLKKMNQDNVDLHDKLSERPLNKDFETWKYEVFKNKNFFVETKNGIGFLNAEDTFSSDTEDEEEEISTYYFLSNVEHLRILIHQPLRYILTHVHVPQSDIPMNGERTWDGFCCLPNLQNENKEEKLKIALGRFGFFIRSAFVKDFPSGASSEEKIVLFQKKIRVMRANFATV